MVTRRVAVLAAVVAAAACIAGAALADTGPSPAEIAAMVAAPPAEQVLMPTHRISPQEAMRTLTAADVAPGLTVRQAVGLDSLPDWFLQQEQQAVRTTAAHAPATAHHGRQLAYTSGSVYCWAGSRGATWGIWPYQQTVNDHASWCAHYQWGMTALSHSASLDATLCAPNGSFSYPTGGYPLWSAPYAAYVSGGYFSCPLSGIYLVHETRTLGLEVNSYGNYWITSKS